MMKITSAELRQVRETVRQSIDDGEYETAYRLLDMLIGLDGKFMGSKLPRREVSKAGRYARARHYQAAARKLWSLLGLDR
jgi:hypothetical protein